MRGDFENIWKDAFEGASVTPSDEVWSNISARMDSGSGRKNWVTILIIAATVTVAFAFPLTVGNSEYEFKPQKAELAEVNSATTKFESAPTEIVSIESEQSALLTEKTISKTNPEVALTPVNEEAELTADKIDNFSLIESEPIGIFAYQHLQGKPASGLDYYYILPAFKRETKNFNRNLMAFGNINSGRQSATSGFSNMDFLAASADFEQSPNLNNREYADRSEDGGVAFYLGVGVELPVSKRINLSAGLGYQNQRLNGSSNTIIEENGVQYPVGIYDPLLPGTIFLSENYDYISSNQFISIPVGAKYAIIDKRIKLRFGLGLSPDIMLSHKVSSTDYGTRQTKLGETMYNKFQFTGLVNFDVLLPLHSNYGLAVETGLRQGLVPYVENGSEFVSSFNFGVILFYQVTK